MVHTDWRRKGGRKKKGGCAFPHWLCSQLRRALRDSTAEHGVHFCHRLRKVTRKNRSIWGEKNSQSGIKYRRVRKVQTSPSVCVWRWEREEAYTGNSTLLGHTGTLRQRKLHAEHPYIGLGWVIWMICTPFRNHGRRVWKVCLVTLIRSCAVQKLG